MKISRGGKIALPQGEKSSEKIEISAIEETEAKNKYFKHLNDRFNNNYGGRIDGSLDSLDEKLVIDNISAFENTLNQFKEIHPYIKPQIMATNLENKTYGAADMESGHMILNKTKYKDGKSIIASYQRDVDAGFHPRGTTARNIASHEAGHLVIGALSRKLNLDKNDTARLVLKKAFSNKTIIKHFRDSGLLQTKKKDVLQYVNKNVSAYATKNTQEMAAEMIAEYSAKRSQSSLISRVFHQELKKAMKGG